MGKDWRVVPELGLGVLRARGTDVVSFLQGQLSNDAGRLQAGQLQLSGYHTPQGRAIALLRLTPLAPDDLLAVLPRELVPVVVTRLKRYVLRAKVQLSDASTEWPVVGYRGVAPAVPAGGLRVPYGTDRHLLLQTDPSVLPDAAAQRGSRDDWAAADIAEGLPQVYLPTSEAFVAQMLNLDLTSGIAFDKGCYTGQEIIARAHYRGQVKRRMQRFLSDLPCELEPGHTGLLTDGRSFRVVESAVRTDGCCEFLAVTHPPAGPDAGAPGTHSEATELAGGDATHTLVAARQLSLPYELPGAPTRSRSVS